MRKHAAACCCEQQYARLLKVKFVIVDLVLYRLSYRATICKIIESYLVNDVLSHLALSQINPNSSFHNHST